MIYGKPITSMKIFCHIAFVIYSDYTGKQLLRISLSRGYNLKSN